MNLDDLRIAVIGLGYVGLPLAVEFGKDRPVVGFDTNEQRVQELRAGCDSTLEVDCEELKQAEGLTFETDLGALHSINFFIVTVPTPIDETNTPDLPLRKASAMIATVVKPGDVIVFESTVYPGATEEVCIPIIETGSGLRLNVDFFAG